MRESKCRACGALVRWATTSRGYRKPFDIDPSPEGEFLLNYEQAWIRDGRVVPGRWRAEWVSQGFRQDAELHSSHEETCQPASLQGASA